ncbi:MAG: tetratricopeptide repeat protein [Armatimonadetes bacterium]|nr:tetratricopeptide repeat protein [Armatimonadota bacterium]
MNSSEVREVNLNVAQVFYHLGYGFEIDGDYDDAILNYTRALERRPQFPPALMRLMQLVSRNDLSG